MLPGEKPSLRFTDGRLNEVPGLQDKTKEERDRKNSVGKKGLL